MNLLNTAGTAMVIDPGNNLNASLNKGGSTSDTGRTRQGAGVGAREKAQTRDTATPPGDNVSLSDEGQTLAKLEAKLSEMPDIDEARVAEIRASLNNGSYQIDADAIAEKLLDIDDLL